MEYTYSVFKTVAGQQRGGRGPNKECGSGEEVGTATMEIPAIEREGYYKPWGERWFILAGTEPESGVQLHTNVFGLVRVTFGPPYVVYPAGAGQAICEVKRNTDIGSGFVVVRNEEARPRDWVRKDFPSCSADLEVEQEGEAKFVVLGANGKPDFTFSIVAKQKDSAS